MNQKRSEPRLGVFRRASLGMTLNDLEGPEVDTTDVEGVHRRIFRGIPILFL